MEHYERELVWFGGDIRSKVKALGKLANAARRAIGTARGFAELLVTQQSQLRLTPNVSSLSVNFWSLRRSSCSATYAKALC